MTQKIEDRIKELKAELENGQSMLANLDAKRASLQSTMLRIEGAIQVLQEMLDNEAGPTA